MKSAAVPVVATRGHQIAVQVETVVFWDLVPLLQPRPQSFTPPPPPFPERDSSPGATFPSLWTAAWLLFVVSRAAGEPAGFSSALSAGATKS